MASSPAQDSPKLSLQEEIHAPEVDNTRPSAIAEDDDEIEGSENGSIKSAESGEVLSPSNRDHASTNNDDEGPPLPEEAPPLPSEGPPGVATEEDDGWAPVWEPTAQAFYFYNRFTGASQWTNPRVPDPPAQTAPGVDTPKVVASESIANPPPPAEGAPPAGGYNPALHGDYDPTAWYAQPSVPVSTETNAAGADSTSQYAATAAFNRFTGRFQNSEITPENYNDENKSKRQMNAFFDVDAAANSHDGKSLKAERSGKKISKTELKQFKEKRKAKKEEKRRAWLRD